MRRFSLNYGAVLIPLALAACAHTDVGPGFLAAVPTLDAQQFTCCAEPEKFYPAPLIRSVFALADELGPTAAEVIYGRYQQQGYPGRLAGNAGAEAAMLGQLQPLDLVFTANKSYEWGTLIPGRFTHDLIYLGTETQLRAAGLWDLPAFAPLHDDIRAGRLFAESATPITHTLRTGRVMESDGLAILRPQLTAAERQHAIAVVAASMGLPYDYTFDVRSTDRLSCTELVALAMPGLRLAATEAYGRPVIFPDTVVSQAIRGERLSVVGYMVGAGDGFVWRNTPSLMADIAAFWGLPEGR